MLRCFDLRCVLSDVLVGMCTEPFLPITSAFCFICVVCSRVWCGEFVFVFQFCFRFNIFEVACISRSMYMQVACIKLIHVGNLCFVKKRRASDVVSAICRKTFRYFKARQR